MNLNEANSSARRAMCVAGAFLALLCLVTSGHKSRYASAAEFAHSGQLQRARRDATSSINRDTSGLANSGPRKKGKGRRAFEIDCLLAHNKWRRQHGAKDLQFDSKIAAYAQKRADHIAASDGSEFKHLDELPYGENLAWHSRPTQSCLELIRMWYDEVALYNWKNPAFTHETGHFTQLVWRQTERVGCARAFSSGPKGGIYLVCNYDPPGNFLGEERDNVLRALSFNNGPMTTTTTTTQRPPEVVRKATTMGTPSQTTTTTTTMATTSTAGALATTSSRNIKPVAQSASSVGYDTTETPKTTTKKPKKNKNKNKKKKNKNKKKKRRQQTTNATITTTTSTASNMIIATTLKPIAFGG